MEPLAFSETNIANSMAVVVAAELLADSRLIYWYGVDALQTPDGTYRQYQANAATYLQDPTVAARMSSSLGLVTLKGKSDSKVVVPVRPTGDGSTPAQNEVAPPYIAVDVGAPFAGAFSGLGDRERSWTRQVSLYGVARNEAEQTYLRDHLGWWLDESSFVDILDHDSGTQDLVGSVELLGVVVDSAIIYTSPSASRFEFIWNAHVKYVA